MAAITIKNMDVTYNKGKSYVIKDMNLEIKDGEFCVFLGPSGCGKSTAMYCIAGLLHPVHGEICFGNEAMNQLDERGKEKKFVPPQERNIAMVFQEYALYPNMTVRKNMSFALETKKAPKEEIEKRVTRCPRCWVWMNCLTASRRSSPAVSVSVWHWDVRWCAIRRCSCWTSRLVTSMRSSAIRCAMS